MFIGLKKTAALAVLMGSLWGLAASAPAQTGTGHSVTLLAQAGAAADGAAANTATPMAPAPAGQGPAAVRVALLLPNRGGALGTAADAVRTGFLTAYSRQKENIQLAIVETGDSAPDMQRAYDDASTRFDILVGPLSRSAVTSIAQSGRVTKPTIALAQPDLPPDTELRLPPLMLTVGLSIDDEARQVANWVEKEKAPGKIFAIATPVTWQKRAQRSFDATARQLGMQVDMLDLATPGNVLSAPGLAQLARRVELEKPALIFAALDAAQTAQLRSAVGPDVPIYGTSQINPFTLVRSNPNDKLPELEGVHLIDIPWQLQSDNVAVARYPRPVANPDERPNPDLARLYALGIDAFRVARELAQQHSGFDLDGVTGRLSVNMVSGGATYFQRQETQAVYQDGVPVPTADQY